jgi:uncharacterized protein (DUF885 family)
MNRQIRLQQITAVLILLSILMSSCGGNQPQQSEAMPTVTQTAETLEEPFATSGVDSLVANLEGLTIDEFFEISFRELMMRDPEALLESSLDKIYGVDVVELTDISDDYIRETQGMEKAILELLRAYDREALSPEQQLSYDIYEWYLEDLVNSHEFMYYNYPVSHFQILSVPSLTMMFFTDIHPVTNQKEAEDYLTRLSQVDTKFDQLMKGLKLRKEAGVVLPREMINWALYTMNGLAGNNALDSPFYTAFEVKVRALDELDQTQKGEMLKTAQDIINESVIPSYDELVDLLKEFEPESPIEVGVWQFPAGEDYYQYLLNHHTTTDLTPDEIYELGLRELERIHAEMRVIFDQLGYPEDESLIELFNRVASDSGELTGEEIAAVYEALIEEANLNLDPAFDIRPQAEVIVIGGPSGNYYNPGSLDGSRPGAFYAMATGTEFLYRLPSIAYHEAVPGHHFQIALAQEMDLPTFRNVIGMNAYVEGWGLYAERLAWDLGWYEDDPYGNLGRLQLEAYRAARLVIDTGLHHKGWTFNHAVVFFMDNVGYPRQAAEWQIARYIVYPGQATSYMIGMLKILELRQMAMDRLGEDFDLVEFHNVVLSNGSMPLSILERVIQEYIEDRLGDS